MVKDIEIRLGLPSKIVHTETGEVLRNEAPYTTYHMATFDKNKYEGVTHYSYGRYPRKVVFGKLGAKFDGYIT